MNKKTTHPIEASRQWGVNGDAYHAMGGSQSVLPAGAFFIQNSMSGPYLVKHPLVNDTLVVLPDAQTGPILESMTRFWDREDVYRKHGLTHKRGILLHGPPGTGKSSIISMLAQKIAAKHNGIVIFAKNCGLLKVILGQIRAIEPDRKLMVVFEDIDNIIEYDDETELLSILDGENQVDGIVYLATTNNIGKLSAPIVNRPSRFDEIIRIGFPTYDGRRGYIERLLDDVTEVDADKWAADTDGLSIAHIKELVVSVAFLGLDYEKSLKRLRTMTEKQDSESGFYVGDGSDEKTPAAAATMQVAKA